MRNFLFPIRIDRAMMEVAQLQLIRHLNVDLLRYLRASNSTGVSSVRHMMAGTRISDTLPSEPHAESPRVNPTNLNVNPPQSTASCSTSTNTEDESTSDNMAPLNQPARPRSTHRKTYPPGKVYRYCI